MEWLLTVKFRGWGNGHWISHGTSGPIMRGILARAPFIVYYYLPQQRGHDNALDSHVLMSNQTL